MNRVFTLFVCAPSDRSTTYRVREGDAEFLTGTVPSETTEVVLHKVVYGMLTQLLPPGTNIVLHSKTVTSKVTWRTHWTKPAHLAIEVLDDTTDVLAGFVLHVDGEAQREAGVTRLELDETVTDMLRDVVQTLGPVLQDSGYQHDDTYVVEQLRREVVLPLLERTFPLDYTNLN